MTGEAIICGKAPWEVAIIMMENIEARNTFPLVKSGWDKVGLWCQRNIKSDGVFGTLKTMKGLVDFEDNFRKAIWKIGMRIKAIIGYEEKWKWIIIAVCCGIYDQRSLCELFGKGREENGRWLMNRYSEVQKVVKEWPEEIKRREALVHDMNERREKGNGGKERKKLERKSKNIIKESSRIKKTKTLEKDEIIEKRHLEIRKNMMRGAFPLALRNQDIRNVLQRVKHRECSECKVVVEEPGEKPTVEFKKVTRVITILEDDDLSLINKDDKELGIAREKGEWVVKCEEMQMDEDNLDEDMVITDFSVLCDVVDEEKRIDEYGMIEDFSIVCEDGEVPAKNGEIPAMGVT